MMPFAPNVEPANSADVPIAPVILDRLRTVAGGSPLHLSLTEVVRRRYILACKERDRADKQAALAARDRA